MGTPTYDPIQTVTLGSPANSVTFSSIPATYTDLILVMDATADATADCSLTFNGDSSALYSRTVLDGNGSSATSARSSGGTNIPINYNGALVTTNPIVNTINIMSYANTSVNKTILVRNNSPSLGLALIAGLYRSTSAISSLTLVLSGGHNFATGSKFTLFGVKSA